MAKNPLDDLIDEGAKRLEATVDDMPEDIDPLGQRKLSRQEQIEHYHRIKDDPQAWVNLLNEHGVTDVVKYAMKMDALEERYGGDESG